MSEYVVELKNITKRFPGVVALKNMSIGIRPGEIHGLIGENGAGKSTLIKVLTGVHMPEEGEIYVDGQKADKPGNTRLIQSIVDSQNIIGNGYVARGYCAGYRTEFKSDENPITNLLDGHLTVHTYLAPYIPAEYIENIREYDTEALEAALTGGGE